MEYIFASTVLVLLVYNKPFRKFVFWLGITGAAGCTAYLLLLFVLAYFHIS